MNGANAAGVPAPFDHVASGGMFAAQSLRQMRYRQRRSEILAVTRYLLAKMGPDRFNVRRLAERCELTTQSIYNLIGNRTQIIIAAIEDYTDAMLQTACDADADELPILSIDEQYLEIAARWPDYIVQSIGVLYGADRDLCREFYRVGWQIRAKCLSRMQQDGRILPGTDCNFIAQRLTTNGCAAFQESILGFCDSDEFRRNYRWSAATLLYQVVPQSERAKLEPLLD